MVVVVPLATLQQTVDVVVTRYDVAEERVDWHVAGRQHVPLPAAHHLVDVGVRRTDLDDAGALLRAAQRPFVVVGEHRRYERQRQ
jgi:hypothetical protein